jgi:hypothetical protein
LVYFDWDDWLYVASITTSAMNIYVSFDITRISKGAPRGWSIIICAFILSMAYRSVQFYLDLVTPGSLIDQFEAGLSILVSLLLLVGLTMLDRSFRRRLGLEPLTK